MSFKRLVLVLAVGGIAASLGAEAAHAGTPVVLGQKKPARKPPAAAKKKEKEEEAVVPGLLKKKIALAPRGLRWGLSNEAVAKLYDKVFEEEFVPLYKKAQPGTQTEALDAELAQKKSLIRRSLLEFGALPTGVDNTELKGEYSYRNKESMSKVTLRSGTVRHFFYFEDRLWKVYDEHKLRKGGSLGETYAEAVEELTKRLGAPPVVLPEDYASGRPFTESIWHDGVSYIRAVNREHAKIVAVAYMDKTVQDNLPNYRTAKPDDSAQKLDRDVAAVTRKKEEPPPPEEGKKGKRR